MAARKNAAKNASNGSDAEAPKATGKKARSVTELQRAHNKQDHEAVTWAELRDVHGEGGSIDAK